MTVNLKHRVINMSLMLSLTGEQPIPNLIPLWQPHNYRGVAFAVTNRTKPVAQQMKDAIEGDPAMQGLQVLPPVAVDPYDLRKARLALTQWISQQQATGEDVVLNITGGTKVMTMAAMQAVYGTGVPLLYVSTEENQIIIYQSDGIEIQREPLQIRISIAQYMTAYGLEISENQNFNSEKPPKQPSTAKEGDALEEEIFQKLSASNYFDEVRKKTYIHKKGANDQLINELDIIAIRNGRLAVGSCKSRSQRLKANEMNDALYELYSLSNREVAGIYCGKVLILASKKLSPVGIDRARHMGITVASGNDLENIVEIFKKIIR